MNGLRLEDFAYHYVEVSPDKLPDVVALDVFVLMYVVKGRGTKRLGSYSSSFISGDLTLISPGIPHYYGFDPVATDSKGNVRCYVLAFTRALLNNIAETFVELKEPMARLLNLTNVVEYHPKTAEKAGELFDFMRNKEMYKIGSLFDLLLLISGFGQEEVVVCSRVEEKRQFLMRIESFLETHIMENFKKEALAQYLGMSCATFDLRLRRLVGKNFVALLHEYRLKHAIRLLENERLPVSEICYLSGFNSVSHFNHIFKSFTGHTPSEYRRVRDFMG